MARNANKKNLLKNHPYCVYCGASGGDLTVDHMPNIGLFPKRLRPEGLMFPACTACNAGSTWFEDIVSYVVSVKTNMTDAETREHIDVKRRHMERNHPDALAEIHDVGDIWSNRVREMIDAAPEPVRPANLGGPIVRQAVDLYGAKLALALHWHATGRPLGSQGKIAVGWHTNGELLVDPVPLMINDLLPNENVLQQGRKTATYPFVFASGVTEKKDASAHRVSLGDLLFFHVFAVEGFDVSTFPASGVFSPGCLQMPKPTSSTKRDAPAVRAAVLGPATVQCHKFFYLTELMTPRGS